MLTGVDQNLICNKKGLICKFINSKKVVSERVVVDLKTVEVNWFHVTLAYVNFMHD